MRFWQTIAVAKIVYKGHVDVQGNLIAMNLKTEKIGGLNCTIVDALPAGKAPTQIVVLCHGFGAPGTDLVPLGHDAIGLLYETGRATSSDTITFRRIPLTDVRS